MQKSHLWIFHLLLWSYSATLIRSAKWLKRKHLAQKSKLITCESHIQSSPTLHMNIKFAVCWKADKQHSTTVSSSSTWLTHTHTHTQAPRQVWTVHSLSYKSHVLLFVLHMHSHTHNKAKIQKVTFSWQMQSLTGAPVCPASSVEPQVYTEILVHPHIFCRR